jgi:hypothetical protein
VIWVYGCALGAAAILVGLGFLAFWPEWPPVEPGVHRAPSKRKERAVILDDALQEPAPAEPTAEPWMWSAEEAERRARHRKENLEDRTQALRWHERPSGPQPMYPRQPPIE